MVEQAAVNRLVVGSSPTITAIVTWCYYFKKKQLKVIIMKKLIFSLIAVATLSFAACNSSTETSASDSTVCDSTCADSTCHDSDSTKTVDTTATIK